MTGQEWLLLFALFAAFCAVAFSVGLQTYLLRRDLRNMRRGRSGGGS